MATSTARRGISYGWFVLAAVFFTLFMSTGARNGFGVFVIPMSEYFDWSRADISLALSIGWFVNGLTQPFLGRMYDRFGGRKVISLSLLIVGVGTALLSQTNSLWFLIVMYGFVISTASGGASLVTVHALLARWFYRLRGLALSIGTVGGSAGSLILVPFAAYLIILANWRVTWFALGALTLVLALPMALLLIRDDPKDVGESPDGGRLGPQPAGKAAEEQRPAGPLEVDRWRDSYKSPPIWQLSGAYFVCGMTTAIISAHYVPFAIDRGFSPSTAALAFGVMSFLNVLGPMVVGYLSDRMSRKILLGTVYAVRCLAYAMLILLPGGLGLWTFAVIAGLAWVATAPLTSSLTADIYGLKSLGTLNGAATLSHQMGGALSIYMGGVLYDLLGSYNVPFAIAGSMLAGASLAAFSIREKQYSSRYQPAPALAPSAGSGGD